MATSRAIEISLPYNWRPRPYQKQFWQAMENGAQRAVLCWHRRCGKDLASLNWMICASQERVGLYWHMLPSYEQGRKAIWDGKTNGGRGFIDHVPKELIARVRDDQMKIWFRNGSILQIVGADEPNRLVGSNPVGMNFSEYSVSSNYETCWELMSPILAANNGWSIWQFTPRGRNHAWRLFQRASKLSQTSNRWFCQRLTIDETADEQGAPLVGAAILQEEREAGKSEEYIRQEYYCDFDIALVGAYYGTHMAEARRSGRITKVPWEPSIPVDTGWDLGSANATCIWFKQQVGAERRIIDFYRKSGEDLTHFAKVLQEKPYVYGKHYLPHDVEVKELSAKQSRKEILRGLGVKAHPIPRIEKVSDGIEIVRNYLRTCWFDEEKCAEGVQGLLEYVKKESGQKDAHGQPFYSEDPLHNWASDVADSFRSLACGDKLGKYSTKPSDERRRGPSPYARRVAIV